MKHPGITYNVCVRTTYKDGAEYYSSSRGTFRKYESALARAEAVEAEYVENQARWHWRNEDGKDIVVLETTAKVLHAQPIRYKPQPPMPDPEPDSNRL